MLEPPEIANNKALGGFGLNVMSPLLQSVTLTASLRVQAAIGPSKSPDVQIRHWATFHPGQKLKIHKAERPLFSNDFNSALKTALGNEKEFWLVKNALSMNMKDKQTGTITSTPFFGTLSAEIGFILDFVAVSPANDLPLSLGSTEAPENLDSKVQLPWSLQGCLFNETNVLVWTSNFREFLPLSARDFSKNSSSFCDESLILNSHRTLIETSHLKIILVCGPRAEKMIQAVQKGACRFSLELRGFKYSMYISSGLGAIPKRLFIRCPELPSQVWSTSSAHTAKLSEVIRFATSVISITGIRPYFIESSSVVGTILGQARRERLGNPMMTVGTLDESIKLWLFRKGIRDESDLRHIEELAESLTEGLLMVLHALPRKGPYGQGKVPNAKPQKAEKSAHKQVPFDIEKYTAVKEMVHDLVSQREHEFAEKLARLPNNLLRRSGDTDSTLLIQSDVASAPILPSPRVDDEEIKPVTDVPYPSQWENDAHHEALPEDLAHLLDTGIQRGILDTSEDPLLHYEESLRTKFSRKGVSRKDQESHLNGLKRQQYIWREEAPVFREKEYKYNVPLGVSYQKVNSC
ncbi:hypothetical protein AWENTII_000892 [Aspergillus wentii]